MVGPFVRFTPCNPRKEDFPDLDFGKIEKACMLSFSGGLRYDISYGSALYNLSKMANRNIPTKEARAYLGKIVDAVDILVPVLEVGRERFSEGDNEKLILQSVWLHTLPTEEEEHVIKMLLNWKERALEACKRGGSSGRPRNNALRIFVKNFAHSIYLDAGGQGRGCHVDRSSGQFVGPFYEMIMAILSQLDPEMAKPASVGAIIMEEIAA